MLARLNLFHSEHLGTHPNSFFFSTERAGPYFTRRRKFTGLAERGGWPIELDPMCV